MREEKGYRVSGVVRGGLWLYLSSITNNLLGFAYWTLISKVAGAEVLGITSAAVSLAGLVSGVLSLGVPIGLQRFLGEAIGRGERRRASEYLWSAAAVSLLIYLSASAFLALLGLSERGFLGFKPRMLLASASLVLLGWVPTLESYLISSLRTDLRFIAIASGGAVKLLAGVELVRVGFGWMGAFAGYLLSSIVMSGVESWYVVSMVGSPSRPRLKAFAEVLKAGVVSWVPGIIVTVSMLSGVLAVFGSQGAVETGYYYVANAIASVTSGIALSMAGLLLPVLSGMRGGRERAAGDVMRLSVALVTPLAVAVSLYPSRILGLLGKGYESTSLTLVLLLWSYVAMIVASAINSLVYSYGMYLKVLEIGLAQSVPRLLLYVVLVPRLGGLGAALSVLAGSLGGMIYSIPIGLKRGLRVPLRPMLLCLALPASLALLLKALGAQALLGFPLILATYLAYPRLGVITRRDLYEVATALSSRDTVSRLYNRFRPIVDAIAPP